MRGRDLRAHNLQRFQAPVCADPARVQLPPLPPSNLKVGTRKRLVGSKKGFRQTECGNPGVDIGDEHPDLDNQQTLLWAMFRDIGEFFTVTRVTRGFTFA